MTEQTAEQRQLNSLIDDLREKYNFHPERDYQLMKVIDNPEVKGLKIPKNYKPERYIQLPVDRDIRYNLLDMEDRNDFIRYFESEFSGIDNGTYIAQTGQGHGSGMSRLFQLDYRNGAVVRGSWKKKSNAMSNNYSSDYFVLPMYFRLREKHGV